MKRPTFAEAYPEDADIDALVEAFEAGNYRAVRAGASRLANDGDKHEKVRAAAIDLRSRTEPDRMQIILLVIAALLVLVLSAYEVARHSR